MRKGDFEVVITCHRVLYQPEADAKDISLYLFVWLKKVQLLNT